MSWWNGASGGRESERTWFDLPALSRSTQRQDVNPTYAEGLIRYQARGRPAHSWRRSPDAPDLITDEDRKSTRLNSSHPSISYAVFCLKKKKNKTTEQDT